MGYKEMSCEICGKVFVPKSGNQLRCPDCYGIGKSKKQAEWYRNNRPQHYGLAEKPRKRSRQDQLTIDAIAARRLGVSYGKYIAYYKRGGGR